MQDLGPLPASLTNLFNNEALRTVVKSSSDEDDGFANILSEALATTISTDATNNASSAELLTGMSDDLSGLMLDMQKAELALQLTLQIRNKILDAYNEVMRMSV